MSDARTRQLVLAAYEARRYFNQIGRGINGPHDPILIGRALTDALDAFVEEVPPVNDVDRAFYRERAEQERIAADREALFTHAQRTWFDKQRKAG